MPYFWDDESVIFTLQNVSLGWTDSR